VEDNLAAVGVGLRGIGFWEKLVPMVAALRAIVVTYEYAASQKKKAAENYLPLELSKNRVPPGFTSRHSAQVCS
jgi:hypothetical protein